MTNDCYRDATLLVGRAGAVVVLGSGRRDVTQHLSLS